VVSLSTASKQEGKSQVTGPMHCTAASGFHAKQLAAGTYLARYEWQ